MVELPTKSLFLMVEFLSRIDLGASRPSGQIQLVDLVGLEQWLLMEQMTLVLVGLIFVPSIQQKLKTCFCWKYHYGIPEDSGWSHQRMYGLAMIPFTVAHCYLNRNILH